MPKRPNLVQRPRISDNVLFFPRSRQQAAYAVWLIFGEREFRP
jgi:hypothetical protein